MRRFNLLVGAYAAIFALLPTSCQAVHFKPKAEATGQITLIEPKPQRWSGLNACITYGRDAETICVSLNTAKSHLADDYDNTSLNDVKAHLSQTAGFVEWSNKDLPKIDNPEINRTWIMPSWQATASPGPADFIQIMIPFGFVRNKNSCDLQKQTSGNVDDLLDYAIFRAYFDGRKESTLEKANCFDWE